MVALLGNMLELFPGQFSIQRIAEHMIGKRTRVVFLVEIALEEVRQQFHGTDFQKSETLQYTALHDLAAQLCIGNIQRAGKQLAITGTVQRIHVAAEAIEELCCFRNKAVARNRRNDFPVQPIEAKLLNQALNTYLKSASLAGHPDVACRRAQLPAHRFH